MKILIYFAAIVIAFAAGFAVSDAITRVPPESTVIGQMGLIERCTKEVYRNNGCIPNSIEELAQSSGLDIQRFTTRYGRLIDYLASNDGWVSLQTMGGCTNDVEGVATTYSHRFRVK